MKLHVVHILCSPFEVKKDIFWYFCDNEWSFYCWCDVEHVANDSDKTQKYNCISLLLSGNKKRMFTVYFRYVEHLVDKFKLATVFSLTTKNHKKSLKLFELLMNIALFYRAFKAILCISELKSRLENKLAQKGIKSTLE
jgi:hypothetical protein